MIVVVVIGILAALAIPKFVAVSKASREAEATPILKQLYTLQARHVEMTGSYAATITELEGGGGNFNDGLYYTFELGSSDGDTYVACATPRDSTFGLRSFRVSQTGEIAAGGC